MNPIASFIRILFLGICALFSGCQLLFENHQILARVEPLSWDRLESIIGKDFQDLTWRKSERLIHIVLTSDHDLLAESSHRHLVFQVTAQLGGEDHTELYTRGPYVAGIRTTALAIRDGEEGVKNENGKYSYDIVLFATLGSNEKSDPSGIRSYNLARNPQDIFLRLRFVDMLRVLEADIIKIPADQVANALGSTLVPSPSPTTL